MSDFRKALKQGAIVQVVFVKKDGEKRVLKGTTDLNQIPKVDHPRSTGKADSPGVQRIYDLDIGEWRSVILSSIKEWKVVKD